MKTFKIQTTQTTVTNRTYYIDAESEAAARTEFDNVHTMDAEDSDEDEGIEQETLFKEVQEDGNDLPLT